MQQQFVKIILLVAGLLFMFGCAGKKKLGVTPDGAMPSGCLYETTDEEIKKDFLAWLTNDMLPDLTPETFAAASLDTLSCRLNMDDGCDPLDPDGENTIMLAWKRGGKELSEQVFDVLKDELSISNRAYEITVVRVNSDELDVGESVAKHFEVCGGATPDAYPVVSLTVTHDHGECRRHNIFAFVRTGDGYKLMGVHIRNNDGFAVAMYRSGTAEFFLARGALCFDDGDYDCAVTMFDKTIGTEPKPNAEMLVTAYILRGNAFYGKGDKQKAIESWSEAIKSDPYNAEAHGLRAVVYQSMGEYDLALADVNRLLQQGSTSETYGFRANLYYSLGEFEEAAEDALQAIRLDSSNTAAYNARANAFAEMGEYGKAVEYYGLADSMKTEDSRDLTEILNYNLSLLYAYMGDDAKADSLYGEAQKLRITDSGRTYHDYKDEITQYDRFINKHPENALLLYHRGVIYLRMKEYEKAASDFEAAVRLDTEHESAKKRLDEARMLREK